MIRGAAHDVLKVRGLSEDQISLGGLIFSPRPQQRMSVIPLLKDRTDVDPAIWLIQLSRDPEEMVRLSAVEAMAALKSAAVQRRLTEMARIGRLRGRPQGRRQARRPGAREHRLAPPLPGSASLNPRAN